MRNYYSSSLILLLLIVIVAFAGCNGKKPETKQEKVLEVKAPVVPGIETTLLLKYLQESGDYVNSKEFPSLIKSSIVNELPPDKNLIIDIRPFAVFSEGHIKGAVNKRFDELPIYFETGIKPFEFEKIIIVDDEGQLSSYTTSLLRLMGYGNVYAMRWGMSSWNENFAREGWLKGIAGNFEVDLENNVNEKPLQAGMPDLKTGLTGPDDIADARFKKIFSEGVDNILISADEVFSNPSHYFIINLERKDKYEDGHIPGAVRYKPEATLGFTEEMATIPSDKTVVVYCGTGHNSGFATAYLRLFGYDARTLRYGNNGFMHDKMVKQKTALSWLPFSKDDVNNFNVVR